MKQQMYARFEEPHELQGQEYVAAAHGFVPLPRNATHIQGLECLLPLSLLLAFVCVNND